MKKEKLSPLKDQPLRNPGQSLDEEISKILNEKVNSYLMYPMIMSTFAFVEWISWYQEIPRSPTIWSLFAILAIGLAIYSVCKLIPLKKRLEAIRLGRDGERAVGQYLELLREKGYRIFHDLIGGNFNLDHVIICEHGIFVVETKTYSKPAKGKPEIQYNGQELIIDGFNTQQQIITQAKAEANWLQSVIKETTGKDLPVRPVVVFPGWYVKAKNTKDKNTPWVLNPKALPKFIENSPKVLTKETMMMVSYHISRFIRAS